MSSSSARRQRASAPSAPAALHLSLSFLNIQKYAYLSADKGIKASLIKDNLQYLYDRFSIVLF